MRFELYLKAVAEKTLKDGGSASKPALCKFLPAQDLWSFPKYPAKTIILPPNANLIDELRNFTIRNADALNEEDCWLGTWIHPQTGEYYFDIATGVENVDKAREIAAQAGRRDGRKIVAMFNPRKKQTIFLK
jgi:hypothetical protein